MSNTKNFYLFSSIISTLVFSFLFIFFFSKVVEAAPLQAKFYTNTLDAKVGDEINLDLKINPQEGTPIYTVSADLMYDPDKLTYISSGYAEDSKVFGVRKSPYFLEDTENGMIRLTAGYPTGAKGLSNFTKYKFTAKAIGATKIYIQGGKALDAESADIGLQRKEITINITDGTNMATDSVLTASALPPEVHNIDMSLDILGPTAIYRENAYIFPIDKKSTIGPEDVKVKVYVYNQKTELYYQDEKTIPGDASSTNEPIYFTIPANTLDIGEYIISVETIDATGNHKIIAQKTIGVLSNGQNWLVKNKDTVLPAFLFVVIIALLHHLAKDRDLYFKIREMGRGKKKRRLSKCG